MRICWKFPNFYEEMHVLHTWVSTVLNIYTEKNNGFPLLDIVGYLKNTNKNPKFGKVRQVPTREFPTKFPDWDLSHSSKFGIFVGRYSLITLAKRAKNGNLLFFSCVIWHGKLSGEAN